MNGYSNFTTKLPALSATVDPGLGCLSATYLAQTGTVVYYKGLINGTIMSLW